MDDKKDDISHLINELDVFLKDLPGDPAEHKAMVDLLLKKGLPIDDIKAFLRGQ